MSASTSTNVATLEAQVQMLIKQVAELRTRLTETQKSNLGLKEEVVAMRAELKLMRTLKLGDNNSDVKLLQELLATDPTIYPEGKVTGFFGPMTSAAVKRFQEKAGIEKVGQVGPKTMEKLNMIMKEGVTETGKVPEGLLREHGTYALVKLSPLGDSGIYAHAKLRADGTGKTLVVVEAMVKPMQSTTSAMMISSMKASSTYPAHLHTGACPQSGAIAYALNPVVNGRSETMLEVGIEDILKGMPLSLNMHKSASDHAPVACGNVEIPSLIWKSTQNEGLLKTTASPLLSSEKCAGGNSLVKTMVDGVMMMKCVPSTSTSIEGDVRVVTLAAGSMKFSTNEIIVKKGQHVKVALKVDDGLHDFVVDEFSVRTAQVGAGQLTYAEFTPDKTGTFEFYCSVGNHRAMGMVGKLVVVE
jgi:plastocyanin